jgi:hypothetical protein
MIFYKTTKIFTESTLWILQEFCVFALTTSALPCRY